MFTPIETTLGALLLQQSTSLLLYSNGTILGASGKIRSLFSTPTKSTLAFFAGMAASFVPLTLWIPEAATRFPAPPATLSQAVMTVVCGVLVGWGTKVAKGCTSGHMLCGLPRLSTPSALAVLTFFPTAVLTHHLVHPSLATTACTGATPCYNPVYPSHSTTLALTTLTVLAILSARTLPALLTSWTAPSTSSSPSVSGKQNPDPNAAARIATQFFAGLQFGLGLHMTQMAHPAKVSAFMSFPYLSLWDPSMLLVILFGVVPSLVENQIRGFAGTPRFSEKFELPAATSAGVDWKSLGGAVVFGVGWGLTGTCPGPAILRSLAQPAWGVLWMGGFWAGGRVVGG